MLPLQANFSELHETSWGLAADGVGGESSLPIRAKARQQRLPAADDLSPSSGGGTLEATDCHEKGTREEHGSRDAAHTSQQGLELGAMQKLAFWTSREQGSLCA